MVYLEIPGELQPAKKFSSPTPAKSDFLLSEEISGEGVLRNTAEFTHHFKNSDKVTNGMVKLKVESKSGFIFEKYTSMHGIYV